MDVVSPVRRSAMMAGIKSKNTQPELTVRRLAHRLGLRFRLHRKDLPGSPDLIFPRRKAAVFVHGCYWHRHDGCRFCYSPKTNVEFWTAKFESNLARDLRNAQDLEARGWKVVVIWECETKKPDRVREILKCEVCDATC